MDDKKTNEIIKALNSILEFELAGVVRYTHYALMVYGYNRIPIVSWLREQATESLGHADKAGEIITHLGGHPSLAIGPLLETHNHDIGDILRESLAHELNTLNAYKNLLNTVGNDSVMLEEYAREMIYQSFMLKFYNVNFNTRIASLNFAPAKIPLA